MHELALVTQVVEIACERSGGAKVRRVVLEIGQLSLVLPDAVRFCFDIVASGTACQGATLDIVQTPGRGRCRRCGRELALASLLAECACGDYDIEVIGGQELRVKEMEVL
jgi:hydrogenase nickel incorporation protein HypA/HybF